MSAKAISASPCSGISVCPARRHRTSQLCVQGRSDEGKRYTLQQSNVGLVRSSLFKQGMLKAGSKLSRRQSMLYAISQVEYPGEEVEVDATDPGNDQEVLEGGSPASISSANLEKNEGKPGFISFYNRWQTRDDVIDSSGTRTKQNGLLWFIGPTVLVASFIFPSLYLRRILSTIFEDSLLTDFLILFFTEALFYCGVGGFLVLMDYLWRPAAKLISTGKSDGKSRPFMWHRISSIVILLLSLVIPLVTMGFVWPWTGPAASATLAPYLVGIVVQYAFEQYARYSRSPSWPVIHIIFQVYRLHQLNRAAQLVTALSFTVRAAETTPHNLAISSSLGTLLNVLQLLGVICIWSLASFLIRVFPSSAITER